MIFLTVIPAVLGKEDEKKIGKATSVGARENISRFFDRSVDRSADRRETLAKRWITVCACTGVSARR